MANTYGPPPTGQGWDENYPDINDPYGNVYAELSDLRIGLRSRLEKEHVTPDVDGAGCEHLQGSAKIYIGDYSVAWPDKRPDTETDLDSDDYGRLALDTTSSPKRIAIYTATGWTLLGTLIGGSIVTGDVKLAKSAADPTDEADYGFIYTKNVGDPAVTELFYVDSDGNVKQLTNDGKLNIVAADIPADEIDDTKIRLRNNQYLTARNAGDDGDVNLIKANGSDIPVLPDGSQLATDAAPTEDAGIANKAYVDTNAVLKDIDGTPTQIYTKYITGTLDNDDLTQVAHGIATGKTKIMNLFANVLSGSSGRYQVAEFNLTLSAAAGFAIVYDDNNVYFTSVGANLQGQAYKIKIDYVA